MSLQAPLNMFCRVINTRNIYKEISLRKTKEDRIRNVRYSEKFVNSVLHETSLKSKRFTGKQGTVILFDSRGIHRGSPIINGKRYALTNYFITSSQNQGIGDFLNYIII